MASKKEDNWIRRFTVTDPFRHHKGFTLYKVTSFVYPKKYPEAVTKIIVWKRYNDFKKLHKELKICHKKLNLEDDFPPFVKAKFFSRFESDVVEERRQSALKLLEFVARNPPLFTSDVFVKFFESGYEVDDEDCSFPITPVSDTSQSLGSDDDHTSVTTDTDSVNLPAQGPEAEDLSIEEDTWSGYHLKSSLSQTTLNSLASVESIFSRRLQSFKNRFIGTSDTSDARQREAEMCRYWMEVQDVVGEAENREREGDYQAAFDCYKAAVARLLQGVQNDTDRDRRKLVKERTADYLCKAEFIANHFLSPESNSASKKEHGLVPLSQLWQPLPDLQFYKVVGIVGRVMLVIDSRTHYLFIIKALYKSAHPVRQTQSCILPRRVPYMVELNSIFETDCAVFLVLQYVSGGKLWDYVSPYLRSKIRSRRSSIPQPTNHADASPKTHMSTSDSCPSALNLNINDHCEVRSTLSSPGTSYLDLIRDYAANKQVESELCATANDLPPTSSYPLCSDLLVDRPESPLYKIVSDTLSFQESSGGNELPTLTSSCDTLYRDVLTLVNSEFTLNIEDSVDIDTKDLVEHAQRLLQSVDATLLESQSVISRLELGQPTGSADNQAVDKHTLAVVDSDMSREFDRLSIVSNHSNKSLDVCRLMPYVSSKGSSPPSSLGLEGPPQWCQLDPSGEGVSEETVRRWAAQLLVALNALHQTGITCLDLNPANVLVCGSALRLTYFCSVPGVEPQLSSEAQCQLYIAPEVMGIFPATVVADWWSLGTLLYHLLTGQSLSSHYPSGIYCHTILYIPDTVSEEARSLLKELLRCDPQERLGSGLLGVEEIKSHPFFERVQWDLIYDEGLAAI